MKRKGFLMVTGCASARLDTLAARDQLPFVTEPGKWSDYSLNDAFRLRLMLDAAEIMDVSTASKLARLADDRFYPLDVMGFTGDRDLWAGVVFYTFDDMPEDWDNRYVVGGLPEELFPDAERFIENLAPGARILGLTMVNASSAARRVRQEAHEIGLPEAQDFPPIPDDLTGFPAWFTEVEMKRRNLFVDPETDQ